MYKFSVGDVVSYVRNSDGEKIIGIIDKVDVKYPFVGQMTRGRSNLPRQRGDCDVHGRATTSPPSYRLWFSKPTRKKVGHPVTITEDRLSPEPDGILLRLLYIERPLESAVEEARKYLRTAILFPENSYQDHPVWLPAGPKVLIPGFPCSGLPIAGISAVSTPWYKLRKYSISVTRRKAR